MNFSPIAARKNVWDACCFISPPQSGATGKEPEADAKLNVSHDDLARMAAMSRPQVTLTLNNFRRRRLVHYERGRPLMVHVAALRAYLTGEHGL
ncbi:MAG: helix-turn-helix domain-containing protein [Pyrinomonadaceae bacterium]